MFCRVELNVRLYNAVLGSLPNPAPCHAVAWLGIVVIVGCTNAFRLVSTFSNTDANLLCFLTSTRSNARYEVASPRVCCGLCAWHNTKCEAWVADTASGKCFLYVTDKKNKKTHIATRTDSTKVVGVRARVAAPGVAEAAIACGGHSTTKAGAEVDPTMAAVIRALPPVTKKFHIIFQVSGEHRAIR